MLEPRPPIVTILGHVDHGKTTLLDALRKTNVASREAGGITQSIGASVITTKDNRKITFIDTPGHAAFTQMRSRGAKVCDVAILIVASDDGVKPQTKEAIRVILAENTPYIVCLTKTDLPNSNPDSVVVQLEKEGILFEGRGGNTPYLKVSAKKNEGLDELLEMISLLSDVNEVKADPDGKLDAYVVETRRDKRGSLASVIIRDGTLAVNDKIVSDGVVTKIRGLFDQHDSSVKQVKPGEPVMILGFDKMPDIGARIQKLEENSETGFISEKTDKYSDQRDVVNAKINLVIKTQTSGGLEAVMGNLPKDVCVVYAGVGEVIEADIFLAKSVSNCKIFAFEAKIPSQILKLADNEGVIVESFNIIYKLFERINELLEAEEEQVTGRSEIIAMFPFNNKKVAGCKVINGKIGKNDQIRILRSEKIVGEVKILSLKKEKKDILEAKQGEQFGAILHPQLDFKVGDMLISHIK